jgi:hypothetical protein
LLLTGCSDVVDQDQPRRQAELTSTLAPGRTVGQTFVARHAGLNGVELWLVPEDEARGTLTLHLRSAPQAETDIVTATLPLAQITDSAFHRFSFPPLRDSHGQYYYAVLELSGAGQVRVGSGPGDAYLDGALYRDHEPQDAQMAFRLTYDPRRIAIDLMGASLRGLGLLAVAGLLYVVPGWALLTWLWPERLSWAEKLGLSAGLSLALYPLLLLWTDLVGLHLGPLYAWLPMLGGIAALLWRYRAWRPRQGWKTLQRWADSEVLWPDVTLLIVLGLVFGVRLLVVRTLDAPMWGDSYQHTMIAQLLVDNGGLFDSWEPYTPYRSLTVHFGFPTTVALFSWITQLGSTQATLLIGQIINGLSILTIYPLTVRIADDNRWAGVGAVLVAGLLSPMPAEYVNWGRYAQLAGQTVLPVAIWLLLESVEQKEACHRSQLVAGIVLAGMTLNYYRMPFYYAAFTLAWLMGWGLPHWKANAKLWLKRLGRLSVIAIVFLLFFLPWGLQIAGGTLANTLSKSVTQDSPVKQVLNSYQAWYRITSYVPLPLLILSGVTLIWSVMRKHWAIISIGLWILGLVSLVATRLIHLPGSNFMQHFAIQIALYIPVGLLTGWLIGESTEQVTLWEKQWIIGGLVVLLAAWGAREQTSIVKPSYVMVTRPDMQAMAWIRENTSSQSRFLVEGFRIYEGWSAVGADAGWWIPLLTKRENTMPPQYALINEEPADPGYTDQVVDLVAHLERLSPSSPEGLQSICKWDITHVYVGQGQGKTGAQASQLFSPDDLKASPEFRQVYQQDRVHIFALDSQSCEPGTQE